MTHNDKLEWLIEYWHDGFFEALDNHVTNTMRMEHNKPNLYCLVNREAIKEAYIEGRLHIAADLVDDIWASYGANAAPALELPGLEGLL